MIEMFLNGVLFGLGVTMAGVCALMIFNFVVIEFEDDYEDVDYLINEEKDNG